MEEKKDNEIDYSLKLRNFLAMTQSSDQERAIALLQEANWDETVAANNFFARPPPTNESHAPIYNASSQLFNDSDLFDMPQNKIEINSSPNQSSVNINRQPQTQGILSKLIGGFWGFITGFCKERREVDLEEEDQIFSKLPSRIRNFNSFSSFLKTKICVIILYEGRNLDSIRELIFSIVKNEELCRLIKKDFVFYGLLASCNEGTRILSMTANNFTNFPLFLFCTNLNNSTVFTPTSVFYQTEGEKNVDEFHNELNKVLDMLKEKRDNSSSIADIISKQQDEMHQLEIEEEIKAQEKKEREIKLQQEKEEEEKKQSQIKKKAEEAKKKIAEEPNEGDPNSTLIIFRYPDGDKRVERRFLKSSTIQDLYNFIESLGSEIYTEPENDKFTLIQSFPFKAYTEMNKTLEEEGLFNAVLQIRED